MKRGLVFCSLLLVLFLALSSTALANSTWYVDGVNGSDNNNNCKSAQTACKTIGHAISLASSGDSIMVAAAIYIEKLTIGSSLKITGSNSNTAIIDGGANGTVTTISNTSANVTLSSVTIRNGFTISGGGINNSATLTINNSIISGNTASYFGGGIYNSGVLAINNSTISGNYARPLAGQHPHRALGGGIENYGTMTINNSTISGNAAGGGGAIGGGIANIAILTITNSTITGNTANAYGGGIANGRTLAISNSTLSGNGASTGGGIYNYYVGTAALQNNIVANSPSGGNCGGTPITSNGYNLSSDNTCNFRNTGDLNNTDPKLGPLQNNGGPTRTMALPSGSRAIDAGNPKSCTDGHGHLLTTDQRGEPRPDKEDSAGCDMGAYESQAD